MSDFSRDTKNQVEIKSFKPRSLSGEVANDYKEVKQKFGSLASTDPQSNSHFSLHPASKKNLGVEAEERSHLETLVSEEVEARMQELKAAAFQEGFERGREEGNAKASTEFFNIVQPQFEQFSALLHELDQVKTDVYQANEQFLIQLIFQIGKNILLDEVKADRNYVRRLSSQIIEKLGAKDNIRLKVSRADYTNLEQLRDFLKGQFPDLKNIQIDPSDDMLTGGVKVETDLSRINASVDAQLRSIQASLSGESQG